MNDLWRHRKFLLLLSSHALGRLAETLFTVGLMVDVFRKTGSALGTAAVLLAGLLPSFLLSPIAGALVDRYCRRQTMLVSHLVRALLVLGLWVTGGWVWPPSLILVYGVVAGLGAAGAFYEPARLAILPGLLDKGQLVRANSLVAVANQTILALGYILGGFLTLHLSLQAFATLVWCGYLSAAAITLLLPVVASARPAQPRVSMIRDIGDGLAQLRRHKLARPLLVMEGMEHVPHGIWTSALMLVFVDRALDGEPSAWGLQNGMFFSGQVVGALVATLAARTLARRAGWAIILDTALNAALTVAYALSPTNLVAVVVSFLFGPPYAIRDVAQDTLLQASVPGEVLGRIYALRDALRNAVFLLASTGFAILADYVPIRGIYLIGGGLYAVTALYALSSPALRAGRIEVGR